MIVISAALILPCILSLVPHYSPPFKTNGYTNRFIFHGIKSAPRYQASFAGTTNDGELSDSAKLTREAFLDAVKTTLALDDSDVSRVDMKLLAFDSFPSGNDVSQTSEVLTKALGLDRREVGKIVARMPEVLLRKPTDVAETLATLYLALGKPSTPQFAHLFTVVPRYLTLDAKDSLQPVFAFMVDIAGFGVKEKRNACLAEPDLFSFSLGALEITWQAVVAADDIQVSIVADAVDGEDTLKACAATLRDALLAAYNEDDELEFAVDDSDEDKLFYASEM